MADGPRNRVLAFLKVVCAQHRYESAILPLSVKLQFPRSVDFEELVSRMSEAPMKEIITSIFEEPWNSWAMKEDKDRPVPYSYDTAVLAEYLERKEERACAG